MPPGPLTPADPGDKCPDTAYGVARPVGDKTGTRQHRRTHSMTLTRRNFSLSLLATLPLAACGNGIGGGGAATIDARVDSSLSFMFSEFPGTRDLAGRSAGMLVMPLITEAGLGLGGSFGRGALKVQNATVDYYSAAAASAGLQIGVQQYSHVLFFMTPDALLEFRTSPGWVAGAGVEYAVSNNAETLLADTTTTLSPVIAVIFGQTGLRLGATVEGVKYTRIIP
jgi:lipid-binding SYLF domain-containing protein